LKKRVSILVIILILIWSSYKAYLLFKYPNITGIENLNNITDISITTNKNIQNTKIENMSLYIPERFEESKLNISTNETTKTFTLTGESDDYTQIMFIGVDKNKLEDTIKNDLDLKNINYQKLLKKYNIENEIDLIKYYEKNKDTKRNIFWSKSHIEINYLVKEYIIVSMTVSKTSSYLTNDLNGFITYNNEDYYIRIANNDDIYYLTITSHGNKIEYNEVINILESITFD
jgi:hypothetical protein